MLTLILKISLIIILQTFIEVNNSIWFKKFIKNNEETEKLIKNLTKCKKLIKNLAKLKTFKKLGFLVFDTKLIFTLLS